MDIAFVVKFVPKYMSALGVALRISVVSIIMSVVFGFVCAVILYSKFPILSSLVRFYIEVSRNTPLIVQLFFLYFGLPHFGFRISGQLCSTIGLCFLGTGYMAESIRSGLDKIGKLEIESAYALGLDKVKVVWYIIIPQALPISMPSIFSNMVFLFKETSVLSAIAIPDPMYVTKDLIGLYHKTDEGLLLLIATYALVLLPFNFIVSKLEEKVNGNVRI